MEGSGNRPRRDARIHRLYGYFLRFFRGGRMRRFAATFPLSAATRIIDVGGGPFNWATIDSPWRITLLNVDLGSMRGPSTLPPSMTLLRADGRDLCFLDASVDICYSNSVIEHLESFEQQKRFADELRRVGRGVWVQTPARCFFVEPHLITPLIHYFPKAMQRRLLRNCTVWGWVIRPSREQVDAFLREVRLLSYREMKALFPDCRIERERFLGWTKAYVAVRQATDRPRPSPSAAAP